MRVRPAVLLLLTCLIACCDGRSTMDPRGAGEPLRPFQYEETTSGLEKLVGDIMDAAAAGNGARADMLARSLELESPQAWFRQVFGEELGDELFIEYAPVRGRLVQLADFMAGLQRAGPAKITVERFDQPDDEASVGYQAAALERMIERTPLYSVRVTSESGAERFHIWSFVYQAGGFRWIGKATRAAGALDEGEQDLREYRLRDVDRVRDALP